MLKVYSSILSDLKNVEGMKMLALADKDGFLLGEDTDDDFELFTQLSAKMLRAAETVTNKLNNVSPKRVIVDFEGGKLIASSVGPKGLIAVITEQDVNLETVINELERTVNKVREIL